MRGSYKIVAFNANRLVFDFDMPRQGWVYIAQNFSKYWQAALDGKEVRLYCANLAYQAFESGQGHHQAVLQFKNNSLNILYYFWVIVSYVWMIVLCGYFYVIIKPSQQP